MRSSLSGITLLMTLALVSTACPDDGDGGKDTTTGATDATPDVATDVQVSETTPTDTAVEVDTGPVGCGTFTFTGNLVHQASGGFILGGGVDLGFGGPYPDALALEFLSNETGTFDLGLGANANYGTCNQCVRVLQDLSGEGSDTKQLFAQSGQIIIDPSTPPEGANLSVQLVDMKLVEVNIFSDFHSEEVPNGVCYESSANIPLTTQACVPSCADRVCGSNGCDGVCGDGCTNKTCTLDGAACETEPACYQLALPGGELENRAAGVYQLDTTSYKLGAMNGRDFLQLEFYSKKTGAIDLTAAPNDDYGTCAQCVRMVIDGTREFFQIDGSLDISADSEPIGDPDANPPEGALTTTLEGVRLVEVTYDEDFHATRVEGGACIDIIASAPFTKAD